MGIKREMASIWKFLQEDSWQSWLVSIVLVIIIVKYIFFPTLSLATGASLPIVVVESCSMYHETNFNDWWSKNAQWYESKGITKEDFQKFSFKEGLNKGDIIFIWGKSSPKIGDILVFNAQSQHPLIHREITNNPISTKGDHNPDQLSKNNNLQGIDETKIPQEAILGKALGKIPYLGWVKLIWYEPFKNIEERGLCH